ncbi:aminotransferase class I/II-fold pyridoxal phosphate-dependent enzyme, partial [Nocardia cyriacigeorgica]|uniref:aminotransferase class I/II-fold pyridoxal phosphate-dependent enzyme n=1 Tax=Nocardia cyriacigeorgica TaxID=135487 RepID=UPI002458CC5B
MRKVAWGGGGGGAPPPGGGHTGGGVGGGGEKGLVVASPANPTGTMIDPDELAALARWCRANGTVLISDEIYHGIT